MIRSGGRGRAGPPAADDEEDARLVQEKRLRGRRRSGPLALFALAFVGGACRQAARLVRRSRLRGAPAVNTATFVRDAPPPLAAAAPLAPAAAAADERGDLPVAKVFTFHKDERFLLQDWLAYHCHVFGAGNVVVVDHASADPVVLDILNDYKQRGVAVETFNGAFKDKAAALTAAMRARAREARYLVPIDVDEFVVAEEFAEVVASRAAVLRGFEMLPRSERRKFKFWSRVADCPDALLPGASARRPAVVTSFSAKKATCMAKTFFHGHDFISTDQGPYRNVPPPRIHAVESGNHFGSSRFDNLTDALSSQDVLLLPQNFDRYFARTTLTLLHFSMPDFATWREKVMKRAVAYGFNAKTMCAGVRKGQRYCASFQKLAGANPDAAQREYKAVCDGIANQRQINGIANQRKDVGLAHLPKDLGRPAANALATKTSPQQHKALADFLLGLGASRRRLAFPRTGAAPQTPRPDGTASLQRSPSPRE
ncbi:hypothetical protein M885DRAFT_610284 [Pelagophyceae sp. CCMP2097]|nr:hypothetical protein M885DRAFT_610284 [Pelagophyceae sp. CCMP2097]